MIPKLLCLKVEALLLSDGHWYEIADDEGLDVAESGAWFTCSIYNDYETETHVLAGPVSSIHAVRLPGERT